MTDDQCRAIIMAVLHVGDVLSGAGQVDHHNASLRELWDLAQKIMLEAGRRS